MKTIYTVYYAMNHFKQAKLTYECYDGRRKILDIVNPNNLALTHKSVRVLAADSMEEVFHEMQGEIWSPNGEAKHLISGLCLRHTSMSVGDIIVNNITNKAWLCMPSGFREID